MLPVRIAVEDLRGLERTSGRGRAWAGLVARRYVHEDGDIRLAAVWLCRSRLMAKVELGHDGAPVILIFRAWYWDVAICLGRRV